MFPSRIHHLPSASGLKLESTFHALLPVELTDQSCSLLQTGNEGRFPADLEETTSRTFPRDKGYSRHRYEFQTNYLPDFTIAHVFIKFNTDQTPEVRDYMATRMLHLARISRDVFTTKIRYQRLRMQELQMMQSILVDELEASQVSLDRMEGQIGEIRKQVYSTGGVANTASSKERWSRLLDTRSIRANSPRCADSSYLYSGLCNIDTISSTSSVSTN